MSQASNYRVTHSVYDLYISCILYYKKGLYHSNLVGNIQSVIIWLQATESLLQTIWPNKSIDLLRLNIIETRNSILDLLFVGTGVNNEYKGVVLFNFLHGRLGGEWVFNDGKGIELLELWCTARYICDNGNL